MRSPLNQAGHNGFPDFWRCSLNQGEQTLGEALTQFFEPVVDRRQRWNDAFANVVVVVPDNRNILRNAQTRLPEALDGAGRHVVVGAEQGVRCQFLQNTFHRQKSALYKEIAMPLYQRVDTCVGESRMPKFRSWSSVDACHKVFLAGLERDLEAHAANIHACSSVSAFFRFIDFEAFTIRPRPPISTSLIYEIEPLLQPTKVFRTNVRWTGKSSQPRNVVRRRIQKGGLPEVDRRCGIDLEHGHSM